MQKHGDVPSFSEESLMSQKWSDIITENLFLFLEEIIRVRVFSQHQVLFA